MQWQSEPLRIVRTHIRLYIELSTPSQNQVPCNFGFWLSLALVYYTCNVHQTLKKKKKTKSGTTPYPSGASASAPQAGRSGRGQRPAIQDTGGSARAEREQRTSPEANTHEPTGTTSSATEAPTKRTKGAIIEHTASRREREQPRKKGKGSRSKRMQCSKTESASKEST
jgi:hypothetical protein